MQSVKNQIRDHNWFSVYDELHDKIYRHVYDHVRIKVWDQTRTNIWRSLNDIL